MAIPYRTRRRLRRLGSLALFLFVFTVFTWLCWVIWVERYIVYTRDGATVDFSLSAQVPAGEIALPPAAGEGPDIHYNEGENAVNTSTDLIQLSGYYITYEMLRDDLEGVREKINSLPTNTPVMIDVKGGHGSFYYSTGLADEVISTRVDATAVDELIRLMIRKNLYPIARLSAFQDYTYGLNHVPSGIPYTGGRGALWMDSENCYWLKPTDSGVLSRITAIVLELRSLGFKEVVLDDFTVPQNQRVIYEGDRTADLAAAASKLLTSCTTTSFTLSFTVDSASFPLPEGRCRMYLNNVAAKDAEITAAQSSVAEPKIQIVFLASTNDTRFDDYSVLRILDMLDDAEE